MVAYAQHASTPNTRFDIIRQHPWEPPAPIEKNVPQKAWRMFLKKHDLIKGHKWVRWNVAFGVANARACATLFPYPVSTNTVQMKHILLQRQNTVEISLGELHRLHRNTNTQCVLSQLSKRAKAIILFSNKNNSTVHGKTICLYKAMK